MSHMREVQKGVLTRGKRGGLRPLMSSKARIYSVFTSGQMWERLKPADVSQGKKKKIKLYLNGQQGQRALGKKTCCSRAKYLNLIVCVCVNSHRPLKDMKWPDENKTPKTMSWAIKSCKNCLFSLSSQSFTELQSWGSLGSGANWIVCVFPEQVEHPVWETLGTDF